MWCVGPVHVPYPHPEAEVESLTIEGASPVWGKGKGNSGTPEYGMLAYMSERRGIQPRRLNTTTDR